ncbi:MAG: HAD-IA family hydrolase [Deltaproteobacteria bacterium]|nr:HAD-IA family hydrolase [Deltaproteobacteria bacterium]
MKTPELLIFDLGNVIVNVDHRAVAARFAQASTRFEFRDPEVLLSTIMRDGETLLKAFDSGEITPGVFYERVKSAYHLDLDFDNFAEIWNSGFSENQEVSKIITRLREKVRLFLLSNTNALHFEYLRNRCPAIESMEQVILSYQLGFMKPSAKIFQHALELAGVPARDVWYVDDIPEFVDAARKLGIHGIRFTSPGQLTADLQGLMSGDSWF